MLQELEQKELYTECMECECSIQTGLFDISDNTMYLECPKCNYEMTVWDWYDDWENTNAQS